MFSETKFAEDRSEQFVWDVSSLVSLGRCQRYYKLNNLEGWRKVSRSKDPAAPWGSAFHDVIEVYDRAQFDGRKKSDALRLAMAEALTNKHHLIDVFAPPAGENSDESRIDATRTLQTLVRALIWYHEHYLEDNLVTLPAPDDSDSLEMRFQVPIPTHIADIPEYSISGRIDRFVSLYDEIYVLDRKTTKKTLNKWYFEPYHHDLQAKIYTWVFRRCFNIPVEGFMVDAIQTTVGHTAFQRYAVRTSESELDEIEEFLGHTLKQAKEMADKQEYMPNFASCGNFGGCEFLGICGKAPPLRETYLQDHRYWVKNPYMGSQKGT